MEHQLVRGRRYPDGAVTWHVTDTTTRSPGRIVILRHRAAPEIAYAVARVDTLSNPQATQDAERICAALNTGP